MLHKRKTDYQYRPIETFKVTEGYYIETWENGNKSHVAEEISELLVCSIYAFTALMCDLPKEIQKFVLGSDFLRDAELYLRLKGIK